MQFFRFFVASIFFTIVSGCALQEETGTVVIDQKPYELRIEEASLYPFNLLVKINGEEVGTLVRHGNNNKSMKLGPLKTKYGNLSAEQTTDYSIVGTDVHFRFFLDGQYIGTLKWL